MRSAYVICNKKLKAAADRIQEILVDAGYKARFVDPSQRLVPEKLLGAISHKAVARLAGLGYIGKNGLLLIDGYGPRNRMGTILTDMPVTETATPRDNECGDCTACIDNCPMKVLKQSHTFFDYPTIRDMVIDWAKCGEYEKKLIGDGTVPEKACGRCIARCPRSWDR
jgi:epoxyqueuosine reductase QueG